MDIEQLKTKWQQYSRRLELSQKLNEQLIHSMLRERSRSRIAKIRRNNILFLVFMTLNLVILAAIFVGNPFDFKYTLQYVPYGLLSLGVILAIFTLIKSFRSFDAGINNMSLEVFLRKTIDGYEKNKKMESWFAVIIFSSGVLTALSFLPKKLENKELWTALGETAISMGITIALYLIAAKLGAFKNRNREGFENDLKELNELKSISAELHE